MLPFEGRSPARQDGLKQEARLLNAIDVDRLVDGDALRWGRVVASVVCPIRVRLEEGQEKGESDSKDNDQNSPVTVHPVRKPV